MTDFVRPESMEVPEGGLASFLTATVGEWADDEVPQTGIAGLHSVADHLAEYGRYEDTYMIHASQGETVIPMAVLDENPRLKASLFAQMRSMGIDPERYVVGNELNSINPATGQPEFFLSKLWKGLKKVVKKIVKVFKKVAPIVLAIGLSMTPLGMIVGTALGSGIGTLIQGGSLKDALKMGAIGGLTAGLFKGVTGAIGSKMTGGTLGEGFREGIASGLPTFGQAAKEAAIAKSLVDTAKIGTPGAPAGSLDRALSTAGGGTTAGTVTAQPMGPGAVSQSFLDTLPSTSPAPTFVSNLAGDLAMTTAGINPRALALGSGLPGTAAAGAQPAMGTWNIGDAIPTTPSLQQTPAAAAASLPSGFNINRPPAAPSSFQAEIGGRTLTGADPLGGGITGLAPKTVTPPIAPTRPFTEAFTDIFKSGGSDPFTAAKEAFWPSTTAREEILRLKLGIGANAPISEVMSKAAEKGMGKLSYTELLSTLGKDAAYQPSMLRKYLPMAGAGMGILGLTGGFEQSELPPAKDPFGLEGQSAWDLLEADPGKYRVFSQGAPYSVPTGAHGGDVTRFIAHRNIGGSFPSRDGAIAGPGTGTSDDIRAMLSDGEFVMTADAVRGAGNGDRRRGVKKMYEVMRGFEGVA